MVTATVVHLVDYVCAWAKIGRLAAFIETISLLVIVKVALWAVLVHAAHNS